MMTHCRFRIWIALFLWTTLSTPLAYGLDGRKVIIQDYRGKVVFLHFWATWCKPCIEEFPTIERIHKEYKDKGLVILAISIDKGGREPVKSFVDKIGVSFPILLAT